MSVGHVKQEAQKPTGASAFRMQCASLAQNMLKQWVGEARAAEATGRIATALAASAAASKKPEEFYQCTPASVAKVIAIAALTGIMPSAGATALAYAIPRRPRKGEDPQLQYQLSHRGINALANRAGLHMTTIPVSYKDEIEIDECGDARIVSRDWDNPPTKEEEFRGVVVTIRNTQTGATVAKGWVPKKLINDRRDISDSYQYAIKNDWAKDSSTWHQWYVEMAQKTAMHYAISRGWCVIDDTESVKALSSDMEADYQAVKTITVEPNKSQSENLEQKLDALLSTENNGQEVMAGSEQDK